MKSDAQRAESTRSVAAECVESDGRSGLVHSNSITLNTYTGRPFRWALSAILVVVLLLGKENPLFSGVSRYLRLQLPRSGWHHKIRSIQLLHPSWRYHDKREVTLVYSTRSVVRTVEIPALAEFVPLNLGVLQNVSVRTPFCNDGYGCAMSGTGIV